MEAREGLGVCIAAAARCQQSAAIAAHGLVIVNCCDDKLSLLTGTSAAEGLGLTPAHSDEAEVPDRVRAIGQHSRQQQNHKCNESSRLLVARPVLCGASMGGV